MSDREFLNLSSEDLDLLLEVPVCGCGRPELAWTVYRAVLADAVAASDGVWAANRLEAAHGDETLFYVVAGVLDGIDCTEHGGTIDSAWATDKGRRLLAILDRFAESEYEATPCADLRTKGAP